MGRDESFWIDMECLAAANPIVIDRQKNTPHPRYPGAIYPFDYGHLQNTVSGDGGGIDVWIGSRAGKNLTGILCTFDTIKRDAEIKLLIGCTKNDIEAILAFHSPMHTLFIPNPRSSP